MSDTTLGRLRSRYPGSPPFEDADRDRKLFFGRTDDAEEILHSILSHDLFVLYARSGIGKTSILRAGVMDSLRRRKLWPVVVRLHDPSRDPLELVRASLADAADDPRVEVLGVSEGAATLWDLLADLEIWRTEDDALLLPVLIFDQFEELFTLWDAERREDFIAQFATVVRRVPTRSESHPRAANAGTAPRVKLVLSLREDFLGGLEAFSRHLPQILTNRKRLQPLTRDQADEAIRKPATAEGDFESPVFVYDDETVEMIKDFLGESNTGAGGYDADAAIEAFQLQILCHHIESVVVREKLDAADQAGAEAGSTPHITPSDIGGAEGLSSILKRNYSSEVEKIDSAIRRRRVRRLCEVGLIRDGRRRFVASDDLQRRFRVTDKELRGLIDARLLRSERRGSATYYELAHDSLVEPLLEYRSEQQRRSLRRSVTIAVALIVATAVALAVWLWPRNDASESATPTLSLGGDLSSGVDAAARFDLVNLLIEEGEVDVDRPAVLMVESGEVRVEVSQSGADSVEAGVAAPSGNFVVLVEPGEYLVTVRASDDTEDRSYSLSLDQMVPEPIDDQKFLQLAPDSPNLYVFTVEADQARSLVGRLRDDTQGATVDLIGPDGQRVPFGEIAASSVGEVRSVPVFEEGAYLVVLAGGPTSEATYELQLRTSELDILRGDPLEAEIGSPGEVDLFLVEPDGNDILSLDVESTGALDAIVEVIDKAGAVVATVDSTGPGDAEEVVGVLSAEADWYLVQVSGGSETVGTYSLRGSLATAEPIEFGEPFERQLGSGGEVDRYTFAGDVGDAITLDVSGEIDAVINLIDPLGERFVAVDERGMDGAETATAILSQAGTYIAEISGFDDAGGAYGITLDRSPSTPIESGSSMSGSMESSGAMDVYTFSGTAGDAITLTVDISNGAEIDVLLLAPSGRPSPQQRVVGSGGTTTMTDVLPTSGTYIVQLTSSVGSGTGGYELALESVPVDAIDIDTGVERNIAVGGEIDVFTFTGATGDVMTLTMDVADGLNGVFDVLGPDGDLLAAVDTEAAGTSETTTLLLPDGGTYLVQVRGFDDSVGDYALRLRRSNVVPTKTGSRRMAAIEQVAEVDVFAIQGSAGDVVTFEVEPDPELDGVLSVVDPEGVVLGEADALDSGGKESLTIVYPSDGLFRVFVAGVEQSVGSYSFAVTDANLEMFEVGTSMQGEIAEVGAVIGYSFEGSTDQAVSITLRSGPGLDGQLTLFDPRANQLTILDDLENTEATETITLILPQGGTYTLLVSGFVSKGSYTLRIDDTQIETIPYGGSSGEKTIGSGDIDVFAFAGSQGDQPVVSVVPGLGFDVVVDLIDPATGAVTQTFDSGDSSIEERVRLTLPEDRDYYVRVRGAGDSIGSYSFTLLPPGT